MGGQTYSAPPPPPQHHLSELFIIATEGGLDYDDGGKIDQRAAGRCNY